NVGVTAGASTPAWVIRDVVDRIHALGWHQGCAILRILYACVRWLAASHTLWALGIAGVQAAATAAITGAWSWVMPILTFCLVWMWRFRGNRLNPGLDLGVVTTFTLIAVLPLIVDPTVLPARTIAAAFLIASTILIRLLFHDCLNVQADRISGHRTLPVLVCERRIRMVTGSVIVVTAAAAITLWTLSHTPTAAGLLMIPLVNALCLVYMTRKSGWLSLRATIILDAPLWAGTLSVALIDILLR
ncbi:hypothetical protein JXA80_13600, partial [bacterium]|nr:hypothetical protein [candidate division CSSED10-310 bacterium]